MKSIIAITLLSLCLGGCKGCGDGQLHDQLGMHTVNWQPESNEQMYVVITDSDLEDMVSLDPPIIMIDEENKNVGHVVVCSEDSRAAF